MSVAPNPFSFECPNCGTRNIGYPNYHVQIKCKCGCWIGRDEITGGLIIIKKELSRQEEWEEAMARKLLQMLNSQ
jgi:ribosomal protein S27E